VETDNHVSQWFTKYLDVLADFHNFLSTEREGHPHWLDFYPFGKRVGYALKTTGQSGVLVVDVGGRSAREVQQISKTHPTIPGRKILQDLQQVVDMANETPKIEAMGHNFLKRSRSKVTLNDTVFSVMLTYA